MVQIVLGLGSNVERVPNLQNGLRELEALLGMARCSSVYETDAAGFIGERFYNMVAVFESSLKLSDLLFELKQLEYRFGRKPSDARFAAKHLDVDVLCYGQFAGEHSGVVLPRAEIQHSIYVLRPLAELLPEQVHPVAKRSYRELHEAFDGPLYDISCCGSLTGLSLV